MPSHFKVIMPKWVSIFIILLLISANLLLLHFSLQCGKLIECVIAVEEVQIKNSELVKSYSDALVEGLKEEG